MKKRFVIVLAVMALVMPLYHNISFENVYRIESKEYEAIEAGSNYLTNVTIDGVSFDFNKNLTSYTIEVPYSKVTLGLHYTKEDENAIVEVLGGDELYIGNNSLTILVTNAGGEIREYDFTIIRSGDKENVSDNQASILEAIMNSTATNINVDVTTGDASVLEEDVINTLVTNKKSLVYRWTDSAGNTLSTLTIDGEKVETVNGTINPNIKRNIANAKLLKKVKDSEYTPISTVGTNIPKGSIYQVNVSGGEDIYYLYYYDNGVFNKKPLRNMDGMVEFELEPDIDYALMATSKVPKSEGVSTFNWFWISIGLTLIVIVFYVITKQILVKTVKDRPVLEKDEKKDTSTKNEKK